MHLGVGFARNADTTPPEGTTVSHRGVAEPARACGERSTSANLAPIYLGSSSPAEVQCVSGLGERFDVAQDHRPLFFRFFERRVMFRPLIVHQRQLRTFTHGLEGKGDPALKLGMVGMVDWARVLDEAQGFVRFICEQFSINMYGFVSVIAGADILQAIPYPECGTHYTAKKDLSSLFRRNQDLPNVLRLGTDIDRV